MARDPSDPPLRHPKSRPSFVRRHLEPAERLGEVLFGLIMALTFTLGAGLIVDDGQEAATEMVWAILGCNAAWGIIDGAMYLVTCLFEHSRKARLLAVIREAPNPEAALARVAENLDPVLEPLVTSTERQRLYQEILRRLRTLTPGRTRLTREDLYGAMASFWLVFLTAIPAVLPLLVFRDRFLALRISNGLLLALLFLIGYRWARATHCNPWILGPGLVAVGLVLVGVAMALGG